MGVRHEEVVQEPEDTGRMVVVVVVRVIVIVIVAVAVAVLVIVIVIVIVRMVVAVVRPWRVLVRARPDAPLGRAHDADSIPASSA